MPKSRVSFSDSSSQGCQNGIPHSSFPQIWMETCPCSAYHGCITWGQNGSGTARSPNKGGGWLEGTFQTWSSTPNYQTWKVFFFTASPLNVNRRWGTDYYCYSKRDSGTQRRDAFWFLSPLIVGGTFNFSSLGSTFDGTPPGAQPCSRVLCSGRIPVGGHHCPWELIPFLCSLLRSNHFGGLLTPGNGPPPHLGGVGDKTFALIKHTPPFLPLWHITMGRPLGGGVAPSISIYHFPFLLLLLLPRPAEIRLSRKRRQACSRRNPVRLQHLARER